MNNYDDIKRFKDKLLIEDIDYKEISQSNPHIASHNWAIIKQVASGDEPYHPLEQGQSTQPTPAPIRQNEFDPAAATAHQTVSPASASAVHASQSILNQPPPPAQFAGRPAQSLRPPGAAATAQPSRGPSLFESVSSALPPVSAPAQQQQDPSAATPSAVVNTPVPKDGRQHFFESMDRASAAQSAGSTPPAEPAWPLQAGSLGPLQSEPARPLTSPAAASWAPDRRSAASGSPAEEKMRFKSLFSQASKDASAIAGRDTPLSVLLEKIALCR